MSAADVEDVTPAGEKPSEEVKAPAETKPVKERKAKVPKEKKPKQTKTASHPPYFQMIKEALLALKEKGGSSPYAIAKYMEEKHKAVLPANFKRILGLQLKNQAARGKLVKIKASYKLSETAKKDTAATAKVSAKAEKQQQAVARPKRKRETTAAPKSKKSVAVKKSAKKKKKTKKVSNLAKPKQPKSIKSPLAKRANKATTTTAA